MANTFNLVFSGELQPGVDKDAVINALVFDMGLSEEKATKLVGTKQPLMIKRGIEKEQGIKLRKRLENAGLVMKLIKKTEQTSISKPVARSVVPPPVSPSQMLAKDHNPTSKSENPYATPEANLERQESTDTSFAHGDPQKVPAGHGWKWLKDAYGMFREHPWAWMAAYIIVYFLLGILSLIPFLGPFLSYIIMPLFMGGLMIGANEQMEGRGFRVGQAFSGFSRNRNQLMLLGVLIALGFFLCFVPFIAFFGMSMFSGNFTPESMTGVNMAMFPLLGLVCMGISIPLYMAMWFAPSLVAINGYKAWPALKMSFKGSKKNMLPFLVYGLVMILLIGGVGAVIGIGAAIVLPQFVSSESFGPMVGVGGLFLVLFSGLMVPAMATIGLSVYTGYRDIFYS